MNDENENESGLRYSGKDWNFSASAGFMQGSTPELRKRGKRAHTLSLQARALYMYFLSYVGPNSAVPFPSMKRICSDLYLHIGTVQKYRRELEQAGLLKREQALPPGRLSKKFSGNGAWRSNMYTLYDWRDVFKSVDGEHQGKPDMEKPYPEKPCPKISDPKKPLTKSTQYKETVQVLKNGRFASITRNNNTGAEAAPDPAAIIEDGPNGPDGGRAPKPPAVGNTVNEQIREFLKLWEEWSARACIHYTKDPADRARLLAFFQENDEITARVSMAVALGAWCYPGEEEENGYNHRWHCKMKGKRIKTFLKSFPDIQAELDWDNRVNINQVYQEAAKHFPVVNTCS